MSLSHLSGAIDSMLRRPCRVLLFHDGPTIVLAIDYFLFRFNYVLLVIQSDISEST